MNYLSNGSNMGYPMNNLNNGQLSTESNSFRNVYGILGNYIINEYIRRSAKFITYIHFNY